MSDSVLLSDGRMYFNDVDLGEVTYEANIDKRSATEKLLHFCIENEIHKGDKVIGYSKNISLETITDVYNRGLISSNGSVFELILSYSHDELWQLVAMERL